jgi:hypothetical protein
VTTTTPAPTTEPRLGRFTLWRERTREFLRLAVTQHRAMTALVLIGAVLRLLIMIGYSPALWFSGDSGVYIRDAKRLLPPIEPFRPFGYMMLLKVLWPTHTLITVVFLQHLMGLAVAVAAYVLLQRRGLPKWLSCLAAVPLLFDSLQVTLEQFILVETMFTTILFASVLVLLWQPVPTMRACLIGGGLFFAAWVTKPLALPMFPIIVVYLLVRRLGWRKVVAYAVAFLAPYLLMQTVIGISGRPSVYGSNSSALYGRAASIADCSRVPDLTPEERALCPPPGYEHQRPDWYIWADAAPASKLRGKGEYYPLLRSFGIKVISAQPGDYASQVGKEIAAHFVPGFDLGPSFGCLRERFSLPATAKDDRPIGNQCHAQLGSANFQDMNHPWETNPPATALTNTLHGYALATRMSPIVLTITTLLVLIAFFVRRRNSTWWLARDAMMLLISSLALIVLPVVIGMYEARYALPALPMLCLAAAMSVHHLRQRS